eukprot:3219309-Pyramimonas_sp.AAC.1
MRMKVGREGVAQDERGGGGQRVPDGQQRQHGGRGRNDNRGGNRGNRSNKGRSKGGAGAPETDRKNAVRGG